MGLILVVSKDVAEIETIKAALSVHGWWVTVAPDRQGAIQAAADQAPKLVIIDHAVDGVLDLVRDFGSSNGGPGAIVAVPPDFEASLEMSEAGVDELLTKPISPPTALEGVQRCLAAPRNLASERTAPPRQLFTTEEIFGDVLREVETSGQPEDLPPAAPARPSSPPAPAADPRPSVVASAATVPSDPPPAPKVFDPTPPAQPVVSLAGLFDDEDLDVPVTPAAPAPVVGGDALAAQIASQEGSSKQAQVEALWARNERGEAPSPGSTEAADWNGSERRAIDRPWSEAQGPLLRDTPPSSELPPLVDPDTLPEESSEVVIEVEQPAANFETRLPPPLVAELAEAEGSVDLPDGPLPMDAPGGVEDRALENSEAAEEAEAVAGSAAGRIPRKAWLIGALAAAILVAAGVVFVMNPGADVENTDPVRTGEAIEEGESADPSAIQVEELEDPTAEASSVAGDGAAAPTPAELPAKVTSPPPAPVVDEAANLKAIVDQELERREEELRQVFLEEERKLLRELSDLRAEEVESAADGESEAVEDGDGGF